MITALDYSLIEARTAALVAGGGFSDAQEAFIHLMLDCIFPGKSEDNREIITDGGNDRGIDAVYISEKENSYSVNLFSFKFRNSFKRAQNNFEENELNKIFQFVADLMNKDMNSLKSVNPALLRKCQDIWRIWESGDLCHFRIFLISNGAGLTPDALNRLDSFCKAYDRLTYEQVDLPYAVRLLTEDQRPGEIAKIAVVDKAVFDRSDGDIKGVVATVDALSFLKAIAGDDLGFVDKA